MAIGDIWIATAGGDCSHAGMCPNGPCGPGENEGDSCPPFWTHTAEYTVAYNPATGSVMVDGIPINPGEVFAAVRGDLTIPKPLAYPVEYFRGEILSPPPVIWDPEIWKPERITITPPAGAGEFYDLPNGSGPGWPTAPGTPGRRYGGGIDSGFGYPYWIWQDVADQWWFGNRGLTSDLQTYKAVWGDGVLTLKNKYTDELVSTHSLTFPTTPPPSPSPLPSNLISWAVLAYPNPRQLLIPPTDYTALPLEANPGEVELEWGKFAFADQLRVTGYPANACAGKIRLTIRSACENPPP